MPLRFDGRVVLLTGAADEVPALARHLDQLGATVLTGRTSGASGHSAGSLADEALASHGRIDAVVHVLPSAEGPAGQSPRAPGAADFALLECHAGALFDLFEAVQPAWTAMRGQRSGCLVVVWPAGGSDGDAAARLDQDPQSVAAMGASGLVGVLRLEGADQGLRANVVIPVADGPGRAPRTLLPAVVAVLAHEECALNGTVVAVGAGGIRRLCVGVTPGEFHPEISTGWVAERAEELAGATDFVVPPQGSGEMPLLKRHFG